LPARTFDVALRRPGSAMPRMIEGLTLPMAGEHNVQNALAAIAVALELGATDEQIRNALISFGGVKRRFTPVGEWTPEAGKAPVRIIDDYGHHPVEITAVLKAARAMQGQGQIIAVCQPHRYTRLRDLFEEFSRCFDQADEVLVAPVYEAGKARSRAMMRNRSSHPSGGMAIGRSHCWIPSTACPEVIRSQAAAGSHGRLPRCRRHHPLCW
jgi:UDP-N-acetylmuramate--alanine ligase